MTDASDMMCIDICPGCADRFEKVETPTHPYIGASPGCWAVYGQVLEREYGEFGYPEIHRLTVDAYAVQHPGTPSRRSLQSVACHLIGLYMVLECGVSGAVATAAIRSAVQRGQFKWLTPPLNRGTLTIKHIAGAIDLTEHERQVQRWAEEVWDAWAIHAPIIRQWARK